MSEELFEKQIWARSGKQIVRKYRCSSGPRKGKVVSDINKCYANPNPKKSASLRLTKARLGNAISKRTKKTKKTDPYSKHVSSLNQPARKIK